MNRGTPLLNPLRSGSVAVEGRVSEARRLLKEWAVEEGLGGIPQRAAPGSSPDSGQAAVAAVPKKGGLHQARLDQQMLAICCAE